MSTPTVLRVKRRLEESPQDALVLMCKRVKIDTEEISPSLFVFRATVDNQATTEIKDLLPKSDIKLKNIPNVENIMNKMRKEKQELISKNRYEIVNCSRGIRHENSVENDEILHLIDMVKINDKDENIKYTYDIYTSWKQEFDITMIDNFVGVETELMFDSFCNSQETSSDHEVDDDDDSNDENNWRNSYPDSEPSSIDEDDIVRAMERVDLDDLSSDTGEDKIYDDQPDLFKEDVERYGQAYAKYKARVMTQDPDLNNHNSLILSSRIQDDGYKDDSDDGFYYGDEQDTEQFKEQYGDDDSSSDAYSPD